MNNNEMEKKIGKAFAAATPDVLDSVLLDCAAQKGKIIIMTETKKKSNLTRILAIAAAFIFVVAGILTFNLVNSNRSVYATVSLDVNPSIEIKVNKNEKVLDVIAMNDDAEIVIDSMDFKGSDLDVTVNAIVGSMLRHGYLNEIANSILVSVDGSNNEDYSALRQKLSDEINAILSASAFNGAVLSQTLDVDDDLEKLAEDYGITLGKAQLIRAIIANNSQYTFEALVPLNINELNLLLESGKLDIGVDSVGTPTDAGYIGTEAAKQIALDDANVDENDLIYIHCRLDCDDGKMVYDVEFETIEKEYDYEIDAIDGNIIERDVDDNDDYNGGTPINTPEVGEYISEEAAKEIAFNHANVDEADVTNLRVRLEEDDNKVYYEVDFNHAGYEYDYDIDAITGDIIDVDRDDDDDDDDHHTSNPTETPRNTPKPTQAPQNTPKPTQSSYIGEERAKSIALDHAGVSEDETTNLHVRFDYDDGRAVYEVEFDTTRYEYSYEIDARTGAIVDYDRDENDDDDDDPPAGGYISVEEAKRIAFERAGVEPSEVYDLEVEFDNDDGRAVYEIEFKSGHREYSVTIDAITGEILDYDCEYDD